jgi:hypothetical protein
VLRDPVDRAYSEFWYARKRGWETSESFDKTIEERLPEGDKDPGQPDAYLARGRYVEHLETICAVFPRPQVNVLIFEEMTADPIEACQRLFRKLGGVDPSFVPSVSHQRNVAAQSRSRFLLGMTSKGERWAVVRRVTRPILSERLRHRLKAALQSLNERPFSPPPMTMDTREKLKEYYDPWNRRLERLLEVSLDHWRPPPSPRSG